MFTPFFPRYPLRKNWDPVKFPPFWKFGKLSTIQKKVGVHIIISLPPQCLWSPKLTGWWLTVRGSHTQSHMLIWSRDLARSLHKLKALDLRYRSLWSQNLTGSRLTARDFTYRVTWLFNFDILRDNMGNHKRYISTTKMYEARKLSILVA